MAKTLTFMGVDLPRVTPAEMHRFEGAARIKDPAAFAVQLEALIQERMASAEKAATRLRAPAEKVTAKAKALRAENRWTPSTTDLQRGRHALLQAFEQPQNLPLPEFARLAHKSRQQIYKDLSSTPKRLLALSVGPRRQRLPEWQLDPLRLRLTQEVLRGAGDIDAWTVYGALSEPLDSLSGRSPIEAVSPARLEKVVKAVHNALGVQ